MTLGYTETVTLNAPDGPVDVEAKVDTGAACTSIGIDLSKSSDGGDTSGEEEYAYEA